MSKRMARKIPYVLGLLAVMCMAASSANAGLIVNRDFEAPEDGTPVPGWTGEGKLDGRAAGGKRALLLSAKTRTNCVKASQILPLEGGRKYSVGCSIKTIGPTGVDVTEDPVGAATGSGRVARGGSAIVPARYCRCAQRTYWDPGSTTDSTTGAGFRLVCPVDTAAAK